MTPKQTKFVQEYLIDLNATQAAVRAGYSAKTANEQGARLLANVSIQEAIQKRQKRLAEQADITAKDVLKQFQDIATADPNEIVQIRRFSCRYCYGKDHRYHYTQAEFDNALYLYEKRALNAEAQGKDIEPFNEGGGVGFDPRIPPHPNCPECFGLGHERVIIADTRTLSPAAKRLFAGARKTKDGIVVMLNSQTDALTNIARHLGMFQDKIDLTTGGKPINDLLGLSNLSDDELLERIKRAEARKAP